MASQLNNITREHLVAAYSSLSELTSAPDKLSNTFDFDLKDDKAVAACNSVIYETAQLGSELGKVKTQSEGNSKGKGKAVMGARLYPQITEAELLSNMHLGPDSLQESGADVPAHADPSDIRGGAGTTEQDPATTTNTPYRGPSYFELGKGFDQEMDQFLMTLWDNVNSHEAGESLLTDCAIIDRSLTALSDVFHDSRSWELARELADYRGQVCSELKIVGSTLRQEVPLPPSQLTRAKRLQQSVTRLATRFAGSFAGELDPSTLRSLTKHEDVDAGRITEL